MNPRYAPVRARTALAALAAALAFAAITLALQLYDAAAPRGTASAADFAPLDLAAEGGEARVEEIKTARGALQVTGALIRPAKEPRAWRVRAALASDDGLLLLNTQLVRRYDLAEELGADDHCGFAAAVRLAKVPPGEYEIALTDASDGTPRLLYTGAPARQRRRRTTHRMIYQAC